MPEGSGLTNGRGAVAFRSLVQSDDPACGRECTSGQFRVWTPDAASEVHDDYPVAWSPSGAHLAVLALDLSAIGIDGSPEILAWPTLERLAADPSAVTGEPFVSFDPSSRSLAYASEGWIRVLDLAAGDATVVGPAASGAFFGWTAQSELVVIDESNSSVATYSRDGALVQTWPHTGERIVSSADGSTVVAFHVDDQAVGADSIGVLRGGTITTLQLPSRLSSNEVHIAPDGSAITVVVTQDSGPVLLLRRL